MDKQYIIILRKKFLFNLGNPDKLSKLLNKNVIFNFRSNDLALGGQGAPLAPIYHKFIIEKLKIRTSILCFKYRWYSKFNILGW